MGSLWYTAYHYLLRAMVPMALSLHVHGREHIPATGPGLLVCNHLSNIDPFCLIAAIPRHFHGLAKAELFESWLSRSIISPLEPIKVYRQGVDRQALREAELRLRQGALVFIFAEGTRSKTGEVQEARAGAVFLAQRTAAPIVPIAISGTNQVVRQWFPWCRRAHVQINIGQPFDLADIGPVTRHNRHDLAQALMARVAALLPAADQHHQIQAASDAEAQVTGVRQSTPADHHSSTT